MIIDEGVIVEIVAPGTGNAVAEGEVEVVVTSLNQDYPLFDLQQVIFPLFCQKALAGTHQRIKDGWAVQTKQLKSKGCL